MSKRAIFCYLPEPGEAVYRFLQHFHSLSHNTPVYFVSDYQYHGIITYQIPRLLDLKIDAPRLSDSYGFQAFSACLNIAKSQELDEILYIENDCAFSKNMWDMDIWAEYDTWPCESKVMGGTPVIFGQPGSLREANEQEAYSQIYTARAKRPILRMTDMVREMHVNGALAIYNVAKFQPVFNMHMQGFEQNHLNIVPFDLLAGLIMTEGKSRINFKDIVPITCSYSQCSTAWTAQSDIKQMIELKSKVAVHKYIW